LLKAHNMRFTRQRRVILTELQKLATHPSADEIYEIVKKDLPRISLGTVYRNLETLTELGEIQKLSCGGSVRRFDGNPVNHYHIRCVKCEKIADAPVDVHENLEKKLIKETDFVIFGHRVEFLGLCPECFGKKDL
jgi:Fe2+ or Zn2+ uptake regulation protein